jgi:tetratricopeptide (TPR) repeat protein
MNTKKRALSAINAMFPNQASWTSFFQNDENENICAALADFAVRCGLIASAGKKSLEDFIFQQTQLRPASSPPAQLDFEELLDKKEEILKVTISLRALTGRINTLLVNQGIPLPKVTNTMLTRLKREPADTLYKRNVLRSLAFWLGYERPEAAVQWHYEALLKSCSKSRPTENYREGARIGFALYSRGDVIDHEILGWLRKTLKNYIDQSISHFSYGQWGKVRGHDITTFYVDFPREENGGGLIAYRQCLRSSLSLAHQMAIRWALSPYSTKNRFLSVAVVIGEYAGLDNYLLPLLNAKLPDDPVIRLSDTARQGVLINDIRVVLCSTPTEISLFNGEALTIWWVEAFWSTLYFDFVSELLADPILQFDSSSLEKLNRLLRPLPDDPPADDESNAVSTYFKFPHNSLLGVDIARTLYYRRCFHEALEVLRIVLSINPADLIARTLRMTLLRNIALDSPTLEAASGLFRQALKEARFIRANCACESEDFYCEYAVVYLAHAMCAVRHTRCGGSGKTAALDDIKKNVYASLEEAADLLENAVTVSPSAIRSAYLLNSCRLLQALLKNDEALFVNKEKPLLVAPQVCQEVSISTHWQLGYRRSGLAEEAQNKKAEKMMTAMLGIHDHAIALKSYRPTIYFCHAVALWDFLPVKTAAAAKSARQALLKAMEIAESINENDVCIYSFTRTYGEMIPAAEFVQHIQKCLRLIEETLKERSDERDDSSFITLDEQRPLLMTLNF